jgi:hypothetical protein
MDSKERAALIREGNAAFNDADYPKARELYLKCDYKDGLIRLGDYYMYEKKAPDSSLRLLQKSRSYTKN